MNLKTIIFSAIVSSVAFLPSGKANADVGIYLGTAWNVTDCQIKAGNAGYAFATFGGYVSGYYILNACFGSGVYTPPQQPQQPVGCNLVELSHSAYSSSVDFASGLVSNNDDPGRVVYATLINDAVALQNNLKAMWDMSRDGFNTAALRGRYAVAYSNYQTLIPKYYSVASRVENTRTHYWPALVSEMQNLATCF